MLTDLTAMPVMRSVVKGTVNPMIAERLEVRDETAVAGPSKNYLESWLILIYNRGQIKWARSRDTLERAHLRNGVSWLFE